MADRFDAERFSAFVASFTANANEAEAVNAARLMRREAAKTGGGRAVDLFYRKDVVTALDNALKPVRDTDNELTELRARLSATMSKVTELAQELTREKQRGGRNRGQHPAGAAGQTQQREPVSLRVQTWLTAIVALTAAAVFVASFFQ